MKDFVFHWLFKYNILLPSYLWVMVIHAHKTDFTSEVQSPLDDTSGLKCEANVIIS